VLCELEGHVQLVLPASCGDFNGSMGAVELASHPFFGRGEVINPFRLLCNFCENLRTHELADRFGDTSFPVTDGRGADPEFFGDGTGVFPFDEQSHHRLIPC